MAWCDRHDKIAPAVRVRPTHRSIGSLVNLHHTGFRKQQHAEYQRITCMIEKLDMYYQRKVICYLSRELRNAVTRRSMLTPLATRLHLSRFLQRCTHGIVYTLMYLIPTLPMPSTMYSIYSGMPYPRWSVANALLLACATSKSTVACRLSCFASSPPTLRPCPFELHRLVSGLPSRAGHRALHGFRPRPVRDVGDEEGLRCGGSGSRFSVVGIQWDCEGPGLALSLDHTGTSMEITVDPRVKMSVVVVR